MVRLAEISSRSCVLILILLTLVFCFLEPAIARADTIFPFQGIITLSGNNACNGQCVEAIDVSFDFQWNPVNSFFPGSISNLTVSSNGALTFAGTSGPFLLDNFPYRPLFDGLGDEVDIGISNFVSADIPPAFFAAMYSCGSATCLTDFAPGNTFPCKYFCGHDPGVVNSIFTESGPPIQTTEPSCLLLLSTGLLILFGAAKLKHHQHVLSRSCGLQRF